MSYSVHWRNPVTGFRRELVYETREDAEEQVGKYERRYGTVADYQRATITPVEERADG